MSARKKILILTALLLILIGNSGCLRFLQPVSETKKEFNFVDYDAPALRLANPVKAELLAKNAAGEWESIGTGIIPAGAYVKGRAPEKFSEEE